MKRLAHIREKFPVIALLSLYAYLAFHAFSGSQGLMRWVSYAEQSKKLEAKHEALLERRSHLQSQVDALDPKALDLDVLDERARETLHVSDTKDITIWLDPKP